jgi:IS4 transposase
MEDLSNYEKLREDAQNLYNMAKPILSPALNEMVNFTAEGFNHIIFKGSRHEREKTSQIMRFKLLNRALKLVTISTTYQEYEESLKEFEVKSHKHKTKKTKPVKYWGIIAITDGRKIKVILRKIGDNGQLHFWSIVPAWTTNKYRDIKFISTMKGNPDED